jgi:hypothetical protein
MEKCNEPQRALLNEVLDSHSQRRDSIPFTHSRLSEPREQIRLLEIVSSKEYGTLELRLAHHSLADLPPFIALSYTWGDASGERRVYVNDNSMSIRKNCFSALRQVAKRHSACLLWIDSICINQLDVPEKNIQVAIMGEIYAKATMVVACIDADDNFSQQLVDLWPDTTVFASAQSGANPHAFDDWVASRDKDYILMFRQSALAFMNHTYWTRVWIKQELALANELRILYGDHEFQWKDIEELRPFLLAATLVQTLRVNQYYSMLGTDSAERRAARNISQIADILGSKHSSISLERALYLSALSESHDVRDRIYGLTSLIDWGRPGAPPLQPDYSISKFELALRVIPHVNGWIHMDSFVEALEITHDVLELVKLVQRRRADVASNMRQHRLRSLEQSKRAVMGGSMRRFCKLEAASDGQLTAHLVNNGHSNAQPGYFHTAPFRMADLDSVEDEERDATRPQMVFVGSDVAALVCKEALPGDYLLDLDISAAATSSAQLFAVVRLTRGKEYAIVGQGFCVEYFHLCPCMISCPQWDKRVFIDLSVNMTAEDAIVLAAQDYAGSHNFDVATRFGRLRTRITESPEELPFIFKRFDCQQEGQSVFLNTIDEFLDYEDTNREEATHA